MKVAFDIETLPLEAMHGFGGFKPDEIMCIAVGTGRRKNDHPATFKVVKSCEPWQPRELLLNSDYSKLEERILAFLPEARTFPTQIPDLGDSNKGA